MWNHRYQREQEEKALGLRGLRIRGKINIKGLEAEINELYRVAFAKIELQCRAMRIDQLHAAVRGKHSETKFLWRMKKLDTWLQRSRGAKKP